MTKHPQFSWIIETENGTKLTCVRHRREQFLKYKTGSRMHIDTFTALKHSFVMKHKNCAPPKIGTV